MDKAWCERWGGIRGWLQLVRLPNLLTVPGDPLAGCFLAGGAERAGACLAAVGSSLLFYSGGLVTNDLFDYRVDFVERPDRPLPSGRIGRKAAVVAACLFFAGALGLAAVNGGVSFAVAVILLAAILAYNAGGKKIPVAGAFCMGLCRGLSLLLGASACGLAGLLRWPVLAGAVMIVLYIASVTVVASRETVPAGVGWKRWLPAAVVGLSLFPVAVAAGSTVVGQVFTAGLAACAMAWSWKAGRLLAGIPAPGAVPAVVGRMIQCLLILQALLLSLCGLPGQFAAVALVALVPFFSILARWFYSS